MRGVSSARTSGGSGSARSTTIAGGRTPASGSAGPSGWPHPSTPSIAITRPRMSRRSRAEGGPEVRALRDRGAPEQRADRRGGDELVRGRVDRESIGAIVDGGDQLAERERGATAAGGLAGHDLSFQ